jgi:hypothetical protein
MIILVLFNTLISVIIVINFIVHNFFIDTIYTIWEHRVYGFTVYRRINECQSIGIFTVKWRTEKKMRQINDMDWNKMHPRSNIKGVL